MNLLETIFQTMRQPAPPAHVGEAMALWTHFVALKESRAMCLLMANHTADPELREFIENFIVEIEEPQLKELRAVMREVGIDFPSVTSDKAKADPNMLQAGARMTEEEVANMLMLKVQGMLMITHTALLQSLRPDMGSMWYRMHSATLTESFKLKAMMQKRGWLRVPPQFRSASASTPV